MPRSQRKVLLIGAKGYQRTAEGVRVDCYLWSSLRRIQNIRDYDTIILDLLDLETEDARKAINWPSFHRLLRFPNTIDILSNGGAIIVVGDPRFTVPADTAKNEDSEASTRQSFLKWTGVTFAWDAEPGDTVQFENDYEHRGFENYVSYLRKWDYSMERCAIDKETAGQQFNLEYMERKGLDLGLKKDLFCVNRYRNALAFMLRFQYLKQGTYGGSEVMNTHGPILFLPKISLSSDETRLLVLNDVCGVRASLPEPEWIEEFVAPGQAKIDDEIQMIEVDLQTTTKKLKLAQERKAEIRKCLKLLYEREFALEPVVRDMLRGLGAHVEDPSEPNKEDGWVVVRVADETYEGVLEVKSTRSDQFGEDGRKQLLDWVDRGRTLRGKNYKGIFIGNSAVDTPLNERPWAFSDSWTKAAELSHICAMKTENLYIIHLLNAKGKIDLDRFWTELFTTDGVLQMKPYLQLLSPKEDAEE